MEGLSFGTSSRAASPRSSVHTSIQSALWGWWSLYGWIGLNVAGVHDKMLFCRCLAGHLSFGQYAAKFCNFILYQIFSNFCLSFLTDSWSRSGQKLLSASTDSVVSVWDVLSAECDRTFRFPSPVLKVQFHPRDRCVNLACFLVCLVYIQDKHW